jgi:hypothetical protein
MAQTSWKTSYAQRDAAGHGVGGQAADRGGHDREGDGGEDVFTVQPRS